MREKFTIVALVLLSLPFAIKAQNSTDTIVEIKGESGGGKFSQLQFSSYVDYSSSAIVEIVSEAWTCNAIGFPTCNFKSILRYNLASIPASAIIDSAKLFLFAKPDALNGLVGSPTYGTDNASLLRKIIETYDTTGATVGWLNPPATSSINQKTLPQSTSTVQDYTVNITDFVQDWINNPSTNYGMMLQLANEQYYNSMIFYSGDAPDNLKPAIKVYLKKSVLPLVITNFQGYYLNKTVNLKWSLTDAANVSSILVERSTNGSSFSGIGTVISKSSSLESTYNFTDNDLNAASSKYYYRLKLINKDGSYKYSTVLLINVNATGLTNALQILPNPAYNSIQLTLEAQSDGDITINIINVLGVKVSTYKRQVQKGSNTITLNSTIQNLTPGTYLIQCVLGGEVLKGVFIKN